MKYLPTVKCLLFLGFTQSSDGWSGCCSSCCWIHPGTTSNNTLASFTRPDTNTSSFHRVLSWKINTNLLHWIVLVMLLILPFRRMSMYIWSVGLFRFSSLAYVVRHHNGYHIYLRFQLSWYVWPKRKQAHTIDKHLNEYDVTSGNTYHFIRLNSFVETKFGVRCQLYWNWKCFEVRLFVIGWNDG